MKKIINGSSYNTETAKQLATWDNSSDYGDMSHYSESLYRTRSGKFFMHGEGGAMSKYSESCGNNSWGGGEQIIPLTPTAAAEWAEEKLDGDDYAKIFGEPDEASDDKEALILSIPGTVRAKLERMQSELGKSMSQIVSELIMGE